MESTNKRLKRVRVLMGFSQEEVAQFINVRRETIGHWERGDNIPRNICFNKLEEKLNEWEKLIGMSDKL